MKPEFENYFEREIRRAPRSRAASILASSKQGEALTMIQDSVLRTLEDPSMPPVREDASLFLIESYGTFVARPFAGDRRIIDEGRREVPNDVRRVVAAARELQSDGSWRGTRRNADDRTFIGAHAVVAGLAREWSHLWVANTAWWGPDL